MQNQPNVEFIELNYKEILESPFEESLKVNRFFSEELLPEAMASIPTPSLYRERITQTNLV